MSDHPESVSASSAPADVLLQWHEAVNAGDIDAAVSLCSDEVAVQGPRGTGHGRDLVRSWLVRSGIRLEPQEELREAEGRFVVRELARWTAATAPDGAPIEPTQTWCVFTVSGNVVTSIARYERRDEIPSPGL
jgi:SnoaL-like domain